MSRIAPPPLSSPTRHESRSAWSEPKRQLEQLGLVFDNGFDEVVKDKIEYKQHLWSQNSHYQKSESEESVAGTHIVPITLSSACQRLGHFLDVWFTNASEVMTVIQSDPKQSPFPLSGLFKPDGEEDSPKWPWVPCGRRFHVAPPHEAESRTANRYSCISESSTEPEKPVQKIVKAPMAEELRELRSKVQDEMHVDAKRVWSKAILLNPQQEGDEIDVEWEEFSTFKKDGTWHGRRIPKDIPEDQIQSEHWKVSRHKIVEKETHAVSGNDVIKTLTQFFFFDARTRYALLCIIALAVVFVVPDIAMLQRQPLCEEENTITKFLCGDDGYKWADSFFDKYFGYFVGLVSILTTAVVACLLPFFYVLLYRMSPRRAKIARKLFVNLVLDPFYITRFTNVHGWVQLPCLVLFLSLYVSGFLVALVRMNGGLFPLAHLLVNELSRVMNVVIGEPLGVSRMRALRIKAVLAQHAKANHIEIAPDQLHEELMAFLSTPPNAGVIEVSLPFLTVMAHAIQTSKPVDSVRMRRFVVSGAYAEYDHLPQGLATPSGPRKDVIVDLFDGTCRVPSCKMQGEKWLEKGRCAFPWHFALVLWKVPEIEMQLRLFKLRAGDGCFTWRSTRNGLWATREAEDSKIFVDHAKMHAFKQERVGIALSMMILDDRFRDVQDIKPLLDAKADVNLSYVGETTLFRAIRTGKASIAKELVLYRADLNLKCARHGDKLPMQLISEKDAGHFEEFIEFVKTETREALARNESMMAKQLVPEVVFVEVDSTKVEEFKPSQESLEVKFPEGLQPFRLRATKSIKPGQLSPVSEGGDYCSDHTMPTMWKVQSTVIKSLFGRDSLDVCMSKISELTLPPEVRERIKIPKDVVKFAWCHPVRDDKICLVHAMVPDHNNPDFSFLFAGGFVYFAEEDSGLTPKQILAPLLSNEIGRYLTFKPAEKFKMSEFLAEVNLHKDNFNGITFSALRGAGYSMYAWLHADSWHHQKKRGGFVYIASNVVSSLEKLLINTGKLRETQLRDTWEKLKTQPPVPPPVPPLLEDV